MEESDQILAEKYGAYASFSHGSDPILVKEYGDGPAAEVDRLLDIHTTPESQVLDWGCGAGFTLCRLGPKVKAIWGFDGEFELLEAAQQRAAQKKISNAKFVHGNATVPEDIAKLPDNTFDLVLSRRGPDFKPELMSKLKSDVLLIQELYQDSLALFEIFGRKTSLRDTWYNPHNKVALYQRLNLFPVSIKEYFTESFFRDADHLIAFLSRPNAFYSWPMPPTPYEETRDRAALELYIRYNSTQDGIRVINHRKVYLFRREKVLYAPAVPDMTPEK